jgi:hypothetical protein
MVGIDILPGARVTALAFGIASGISAIEAVIENIKSITIAIAKVLFSAIFIFLFSSFQFYFLG